MDNVWQIVEDFGSENDAGPKAARDVISILSSIGVRSFRVWRYSGNCRPLAIIDRLGWLIRCAWYQINLPNDIILIVQYPGVAFTGRMGFFFLNEKMLKRKRIKLVVLMHDINSFRYRTNARNAGLLNRNEERIVKMGDALVVLNDTMKNELVSVGVPDIKMVSLGAWDYLQSTDRCHRKDSKHNVVIVAGNLNPMKAGYLTQLKEIAAIRWRLYGAGYTTECECDEIEYCGCFSPEELPSKFDGDFGLVWDGNSIETCDGPFGEYLKINAPHKLSLFISSGIPVFIWKGAALAEFVVSNGIGFAIEKLSDIPVIVSNLKNGDYDDILRNVAKIGEKMRTGFYVKKAFTEALIKAGCHD